MNLTFSDVATAADAIGGRSVPYAVLVAPLDGAVGVRPDVPIVFELISGLQNDPLWDSIQIVVEGVSVWESGAVQNGWTAEIEMPPGILRWTLWPPADFTYRERVNIQTQFDYGPSQLFADSLTVSDTVTLG